MGLFDRFKKKEDKNKEDKNKEEVRAVGWDAITDACEKIYPDQ